MVSDNDDQARLRELMRHRATVVLTGEDVLRAVGLGGQGFTVLGVRDDFVRQGIRIMVFHPDLPEDRGRVHTDRRPRHVGAGAADHRRRGVGTVPAHRQRGVRPDGR